MKKILSILGTMSLACTGFTTIISCTTKTNSPVDDNSEIINEFKNKIQTITNNTLSLGDQYSVIDGDSNFGPGGSIVLDTLDQNYREANKIELQNQKVINKIADYVNVQLKNQVVTKALLTDPDIHGFINGVNPSDVLKVNTSESRIYQLPYHWSPDVTGPHGWNNDKTLQLFGYNTREDWAKYYNSVQDHFTKLGYLALNLIINLSFYNQFTNKIETRQINLWTTNLYVVDGVGKKFLERLIDASFQPISKALGEYTIIQNNLGDNFSFRNSQNKFIRNSIDDLKTYLSTTLHYDVDDFKINNPTVDNNDNYDIGEDKLPGSNSLTADNDYFSKAYLNYDYKTKVMPIGSITQFSEKFNNDFLTMDKTFTTKLTDDISNWKNSDVLNFKWNPSSSYALTTDIQNHTFEFGTIVLQNWSLYNIILPKIKLPFVIVRTLTRPAEYSALTATMANLFAQDGVFWNNAEIETNEDIALIDHDHLMFSVNLKSTNTFDSYTENGSSKTFLNALDFLKDSLTADLEAKNIDLKSTNILDFYGNYNSIFDYNIAKYHNAWYSQDDDHQAKHLLFEAVKHWFQAYIYLDIAGFNFQLNPVSFAKTRVYY
ncbi:hypothetical protein [Spiroplasma sp. SV19]|uniref:hypothetical protein n=1 Tax=Spiroplasma sp. SV19 TaxID=2570468 RepID=UPI0024B724DB|nr:hypothetical protein [Spiroplasma sp. SV19]WHQ36445.1 hypothetical protein E7Y35_00615 [Spiroplasma sp. SV19]